jgi:hypothetical protein
VLIVDRYVSPRGIATGEDYAPESEITGLSDAISLASLRGRTASLILGEPGAGKSTALAGLRDSIVDDGWHAELVDLRDCYSESSLERAFDGIPRYLDDAPRVLLLDSVDETPGLIRNYIRFLEQRVSGLVRAGWRVIAVCRTAESVKALDALFDDLQEGAVHVLLPLRRSDVRAVAASEGIEPAPFLEAIGKRRLDSLAAVPFTLNLLCRIYEADAAFPASRESVFERAIGLIMAEDSVGNYSPTPNVSSTAAFTSQPVRTGLAAERLAGFATFAETGGFAVSAIGEPSTGLLTEKVVGVETIDGLSVELVNDDFQILLRSPLFADSGTNERQFAHRRLRDFLAAKFLLRQRLERTQLTSLLTVADSETIPPQMVDVATWLVALDPVTFDWLVEADPLSLARNRIGDDLPEIAERLVMLLLLRSEEAERLLSWRDDLSGLGHSGLADQLSGIIDMTDSQQAVALRILRDSYVDGLEPLLLSMIGDSSRPIRIRELAVDALESRPDLLATLDLAADEFFAGDSFAELRGRLLNAAWPASLSNERMISLLVRQSKSYFGSYSIFLNNLEKALDSVLASALVLWRSHAGEDVLEEGGKRKSTRRGLRSLIDAAAGIVILEDAIDQDVFDGLITILAARLAKDRQRLPLFVGQVSRERLLSLIAALVRLQFRGDTTWYGIWRATDLDGERLLGILDLEQMAVCAERATSESEFATWLQLIGRSFDPLVSADFEWAWEQRFTRFWPTLRLWFDAMDISSQSSVEARKMWALMRDPSGEGTEQGFTTDEFLHRFRQVMAQTHEDPDQFFMLVRWLDVDIASGRSNHTPDPDLWSLGNVRLLDSEEHTCLEGMALRYLIESTGAFPMHVRRNTAYYHLQAAYRALHAMQSRNPTLLEQIPAKAWGKLTVALLEYPLDSTQSHAALIRRVLLERARSVAPAELRSAKRSYLRRLAQGFGEGSTLSDLDQFVTSEDLALLQSAVRAETYHRRELVALYLRVDKTGALQWMRRRILRSSNVGEMAILFGSLLDADPTAGFDLLATFVAQREDMREEVLLEVAARERHGQRRVHEVEPAVRIRTFEMLTDLFPTAEEPNETGVYEVTPHNDLAEWRRGLLQSVMNGGTREGLRALVDLSRRRADLDLAWQLSQAKETYRVNGWSALTVPELRTVLGRSGARLARSNDDVLAIVVDALEDIQQWLTGETPQAFALWDIAGLHRMPKDENRISDWYCHALRVLLSRRGLIINREVEVKNSTGRGVGMRQDIRVDVSDSETGDHYVTVIEVKGIWNTGVKKNLATQLAGDYLVDGGLTHGVYLVVSFSPEQMTDKFKAAASRRNQRSLSSHLSQQANFFAPSLTIVPIVHSSDLPT